MSTKLLDGASRKVFVGDVAASHHGDRAVRDEQLVVHAMVEPPEVGERGDKPGRQALPRAAKRIEQAHLDVRKRRQTRKHRVGARGVEIVDEQPHAHAAQRGVAQASHEQPALPGGRAKANGPGCWYYSEANFQGARAEIVGGDAAASLGEQWNDKISSLTCHPLCTLTAFDEPDQAGSQKKFTGDVRFVGDAWNDRISAVSVTCRRRTRSMN